ncbi:MAG: NUDIX domain-containing protein [Actinomycetota bacterium]|nr:NUDIX domain-containing protein [Actinomycetota bacterium]
MASRERGQTNGSAIGPDVVSAGAVVVRRTSERPEVLLVHRPKYDDWSFPKGKVDPGEHVSVAACREVLEETGVEIRLGRQLPPQLYVVSGGRAKTVHYWVGHVMGDDDVSGFQATTEIDGVGWYDFDAAAGRLTYLDDVSLLEQARKLRKRTDALVVLRHGRARSRKRWSGEDRRRPLTRVGREQAVALTPFLRAYGVTRVVTSSSKRCAQTVRPYLDEQVLKYDELSDLSEEEWTAEQLAEVLDGLLTGRESAVLCSHRPVLPSIFELLGVEEEPLAPAEAIVVHHRKKRVVATERHLVR